MIITSVLSLIFTIRSVFNLLFILGLIPRFYPSNYMNPVFWDSLVSHLSLIGYSFKYCLSLCQLP